MIFRSSLLIVSLHFFFIFQAKSSGVESYLLSVNTTVQKELSGEITINPDTSIIGHKISDSFFGSHLSIDVPFPNEDIVKKLNLGYIRLGGNEFDTYNWENSRLHTYDGIRHVPTLDQFSKLFKQYGVEGVFQMNMNEFMPIYEEGQYVVRKIGAAESARRMITKLNGDYAAGIRYISLGNEFAQWHETHKRFWEPGEDNGITADDYIERFIKYAIAVREGQEAATGNANDIKIWGPEMSASFFDWQTGNFITDCEWGGPVGVLCSYGNGEFDHFLPYFAYRLAQAENDPQLNPKGYKLLDVFSIHYYPNFRTDISDVNSIVKDENGKQRIREILASTQLLHNPDFTNLYDISSLRRFQPNVLNRMKKWINDYYPDVEWAVNEFSVDSDYRSFAYHPIIRPLYMADFIGILAQFKFNRMNLFLLNTQFPIDLPWAIIRDNQPTSSYHMYKLFTDYFKGDLIPSEDNLGDVVNSYSLIDEINQKVRVFIINKDAKEHNVAIKYPLNNWLGISNISKIANVNLAAWSVTVMEFDKIINSSSAIKVYEYGAKQMGVEVDPYFIYE